MKKIISNVRSGLLLAFAMLFALPAAATTPTPIENMFSDITSAVSTNVPFFVAGAGALVAAVVVLPIVGNAVASGVGMIKRWLKIT